jgi:tRNA nucleotidyltransferase (CCA-adding enzyme)
MGFAPNQECLQGHLYDILLAKSTLYRNPAEAEAMKVSPSHVPPIVKAVLRKLKDAGFEAYVVGGAVRDLVMDRNAADWDVATSASPETVISLFSHLSLFSLQHGTVTLVHQGKHYEVSTYRGPAGTIEDDLAHRDFTINAMALDAEEGEVIDPHGGREDVKRRIVRAVRVPEDRFREDPLRLLRAVRLRTQLDFTFDEKTFEGISRLAPLLAGVAKERIREELIRVLTTKTPSQGFDDMVCTGLIKEVLPELMAGRGTGRTPNERQSLHGHIMETLDRVHPHPVLRLAALFHDIAEPGREEAHEIEGARIAEEVMRRLRFSERMISRVTHLVRHHRDAVNYRSSWDESAVRRLVRGVGAEHLDLFFSLCRADLESRGKETRLLSELEERVWSNVKAGFPQRVHDLRVDGRKVMEICGIKPGPEVGRILETLLEEVVDHPERNTEETLLKRVREMMKKR